MKILHFEKHTLLVNLITKKRRFFKIEISIFLDGVNFFANLLHLQSTILKFSFFHILSNFYANLTCSPIFENKFKIQIVWSMFESDMTKALDMTELVRQSLQQILAI